jgi:hypothetical protein
MTKSKFCCESTLIVSPLQTRRAKEEETAAVEKEPWQIYSVRKQILQFQRMIVD